MKYELSEEDVRAIHEAIERQKNGYTVLEKFAERFPLPAPPKLTRYRLREGWWIEKAARTDAFLATNGNTIAVLAPDNADLCVEPIPDEPAKVPAVFKRGDWVRRKSDRFVGIALEDSANNKIVYVHFCGADNEAEYLTDLEHAEPPP